MDRISANKTHTFTHRLKNEGLPRLISDLLNPLFVPSTVIGITLWLVGGSEAVASWIMGAAILFYTLIPLATSIYFVRTNKITSLDLPEQKSRRDLFLLTITSAAAAFVCFFLTVSPMHQIIAILSLVFLTNTIVGFSINKIWKISIHSAALSSAGAFFLYLSHLNILPPLSGVQILSLTILLLLLPLMIWARYRLKVHTLAELFGGAITGLLFTILQLSILTKIW